jgi:hypothetical protein
MIDAHVPMQQARKKLSLWDIVLFLESEIGDIDVWAAVYRSDGKALPTGMAERRFKLECTKANIELVQRHQPEIVEMVRRKRTIPATAAPAQSPTQTGDWETEAEPAPID